MVADADIGTFRLAVSVVDTRLRFRARDRGFSTNTSSSSSSPMSFLLCLVPFLLSVSRVLFVSSSSESEYSFFRFVVRFRVVLVLEALTFALTLEARTAFLVGVLVRDDTRVALLLDKDAFVVDDVVVFVGVAVVVVLAIRLAFRASAQALARALASAAFRCLSCRDEVPPLDSAAAAAEAEAALLEEEEERLVDGILECNARKEGF